MAATSNTDILRVSHNNPMPPHGHASYLDTSDGMVLRYAVWRSQTHPSKGTVLLLHGRTETIEKYFETVSDLLARGFSVVTFDWRGQGGSTRPLDNRLKGHIEHFNQYLEDLEVVMTQVLLPDAPPPYYILGHSTGGLTALMAAPALSNRIKRMVLTSPLIELNRLPVKQKTIRKALGVFNSLGMGRSFLPQTRNRPYPSPFAGNKLTSDPQRYARNLAILSEHGDLRVGGPTNAWLYAACRAMEQIHEPEHIEAIAIPTLFIVAGNDPVVSPAAVERYAQRMRAGTFVSIAGSLHEIWQEQEVYRQQALAAFDTFIPGGDQKEDAESVAEIMD